MRKRDREPPELRADDPPDEDHTEERYQWLREEIEWKKAPKLLLQLALIASIGINTLLGTMVVGLIVDRFKMLEDSKQEQVRKKLEDLAQKQVEQSVRLQMHDEMLQNMTNLSTRMFDLQSELRNMNERLKRKGL